jgi:hypothetical protein
LPPTSKNLLPIPQPKAGLVGAAADKRRQRFGLVMVIVIVSGPLDELKSSTGQAKKFHDMPLVGKLKLALCALAKSSAVPALSLILKRNSDLTRLPPATGPTAITWP